MQFTFGERIITVNMAKQTDLIDTVRARFRERAGFALATVNLDHIAKMQGDHTFVEAYAAQDLIVADGRPIVALSQLAQRPVELMPGSDMVIPLCQLAADEGVPVAFLGSTEAALSDAKRHLTTAIPSLDVVLSIAPSDTFDPEGEEADQAFTALAQANIGLCFLALGAPKQERLAARGRSLAPLVGFASVGAGLDFLGGHQVRAPLWMRRMALEWLWRALSNPRRLIPRYARCFAILPREVIRALRLRRKGV